MRVRAHKTLSDYCKIVSSYEKKYKKPKKTWHKKIIKKNLKKYKKFVDTQILLVYYIKAVRDGQFKCTLKIEQTVRSENKVLNNTKHTSHRKMTVNFFEN